MKIRSRTTQWNNKTFGMALVLIAVGVMPLSVASTVYATNEGQGGKDAVLAKAKSLLARLNLLGKPLTLQFTSLDGRNINLAEMNGKVVLIDFWATWCGFCVKEFPKLKELHAKYLSEGFEIVGINCDKNKEAVQSLLEAEDLPWPQYFDVTGNENKALREKYEVKALPTVWLIGRDRRLADINGRVDLEQKLVKLLAEAERAEAIE